MNLPVVAYTLVYNKKDITVDVSDQVLAISYTDKVSGESDTLEVTFEDTGRRWQNDWYPEKGDQLQLYIMNESRRLDCGTFTIDELACNQSISGDIFIVRGIAASISIKMRTARSSAHDNKSLLEIANTIAASLKLTVVGTVPDIRINRVNQFRETDLQFLKRIGAEYGCIFSVRGASLVFINYTTIEEKQASFILRRSDYISFDFRDTTHKTFKSARVKHHDPYKKETISYFTKDGEETFQTATLEDLEIRSRTGNKQQAEAKAKYALFKHNSQGAGGDIVLPGNLLFVAGNNFDMLDNGKLNGTYHILESTHNLSRDGAYLVSGNVKRVKS